ncbi:MAG TPA: hypothetical protein VF944_02405 [Candidatus Bathyarchaeia archaeon]
MSGEPGESKEQQEAERHIISQLSSDLGLSLPSRWYTFDEVRVAVDGASSVSQVLCEAWAHIGRPKTGQKFKVMNDAMKLLFIEKRMGGPRRKILAFADEEASRTFSSRGWHSACLRAFNIETHTVALPPDIRQKILDA